MTTDREGDRTPAQSRAVARAIGYLERGEAGRELAVAALIRGGYPTERAAGMVEGVLEGCFKPGTAARPRPSMRVTRPRMPA